MSQENRDTVIKMVDFTINNVTDVFAGYATGILAVFEYKNDLYLILKKRVCD